MNFILFYAINYTCNIHILFFDSLFKILKKSSSYYWIQKLKEPSDNEKREQIKAREMAENQNQVQLSPDPLKKLLGII